MALNFSAFPEPVQVFLGALKPLFPAAKIAVEKGGDQAGNWWIDFQVPAKITVEWRPQGGFGISFGQNIGYGEGPAEVFSGPERAAGRVAQLLTAKGGRKLSGLRALRELYQATQEQVAEKLQIQQEAVSKLEGRSDFKVETISRYVDALGGRLEVRAVFPDGQMSIYPAATLTQAVARRTKVHRT